MGTKISLERVRAYSLKTLGIRMHIDKPKFIAIAALDMGTKERVIKEEIVTLEKAEKIDKRIWR